MSVADTSALVALLDAGHPHHKDAARDLAEGAVIVTWGTLSEVATVVRRLAKDNGQDGNRASRRALAAIRALAGFRQAPQPELEAVLQLHDGDSRLSFVDAWNLHVATQSNQTLVSYDKDLQTTHHRQAKTKRQAR